MCFRICAILSARAVAQGSATIALLLVARVRVYVHLLAQGLATLVLLLVACASDIVLSFLLFVRGHCISITRSHCMLIAVWSSVSLFLVAVACVSVFVQLDLFFCVWAIQWHHLLSLSMLITARSSGLLVYGRGSVCFSIGACSIYCLCVGIVFASLSPTKRMPLRACPTTRDPSDHQHGSACSKPTCSTTRGPLAQ